MAFNDEDVPHILALFSAERLGKLSELTGSSRAAIELHQETLIAGAALMSVIATVEIAVRNAVCDNLSQHFGVPNWLIAPPAPFTWRAPERDKGSKALESARRAEYAKLTQAEKSALDGLAYPNGRPANLSHLQRVKDRRKHIPVTDGKVIAEVTLHFWKRLYGPDYEHSLWRPTLKRTFPDKSVKRSEVADHLENVYQARNRLAHHEPVLHARFTEAIASVKYITERLASPKTAPDTPLANLLADQIVEAEGLATLLHDKLAAYKSDS